MSQNQILWARVEYQPNLKKPSAPIPLGVVVAAILPGRRITGWVVLGWEPNPQDPPSELRGVGRLGLSQLVGWASTVAKDILQAQGRPEETFASLATHWRWNLYITDPEEFGQLANASLVEVARRLYQKHAGEEFPRNPVVRRPVSHPAVWRRWAPAQLDFAIPIRSERLQVATAQVEAAAV